MKNLRAVVFGLAMWMGAAHADRVYQQPDAFVAEAFGGHAPAPAVLWLTGDIKTEVRAILDHDYPAMRLRYWGEAGHSVWVLDEIGKEAPITVGIEVENNRIAHMRVLVFRESRGWEVESAAFIQQYLGAALNPNHQLDRHIDGISGATLSVRALTKLSRLALLLHRQTPYSKP
ncbi:MAG: FMN-binding protein [Thiobacillaceae bacterium]